MSLTLVPYLRQARKALADRQKELELKTQQLEIKLSNKIEEDIKKARRKSTQAGQGQGSKVKLQGHCGCHSLAQVFVVLGRKEQSKFAYVCGDKTDYERKWLLITDTDQFN